MPFQKGQMFIVTMVFLVGLVFTVQQLLLQYSETDLAGSFRNDPFYLTENMEPLYADAIQQAQDCMSFAADLQEIEQFLRGRNSGGFQVRVIHQLDCGAWDNSEGSGPAPLAVTVSIVGNGVDATTQLSLYRL